jgi:hypothetical protein
MNVSRTVTKVKKPCNQRSIIATHHDRIMRQYT